MHQRLLIAAFILGVTLLCMRVPTVGATALGLADGNYTVTLDFSNNVFDTTATMTVGATGVTAFHANIPTLGSAGAFDCNPCTSGADSPDTVGVNGPTQFVIFSNTFTSCFSAPTNCWALTLFQSGNTLGFFRFDIFGDPPAASDHWSATPAVPEPSTLLLVGLGSLGLWRRLRAKQD